MLKRATAYAPPSAIARASLSLLLLVGFYQALRHRGVQLPDGGRPGRRRRSQIEQHFDSYLTQGGFPEVVDLAAPLRRRVLQEYLDVALLRDVMERHSVSNVTALRRLLRQLLCAPASLFSINRLYNDFRSQGISVGKDSLHAYLDHFQDAFLFFPVPIHTRSERVRQSNPRKIYPVDTGMVTTATPQSGWGTGQLLETLTYLQLRRQGGEISYYRHDDGTEVDFVVQRDSGAELVQVSADITSSDTRKRELHALDAAMRVLRKKEATLVTLNADETVKVDAGTVKVRPFWMWALGIE